MTEGWCKEIMMYLIAYDLIDENTCSSDYVNLYKKLETLGYCCHVQKSVWLLHSNLTAERVYHMLIGWIKDEDKLIVSEIKDQFFGWVPGCAEILLNNLQNSKRLRNENLIYVE